MTRVAVLAYQPLNIFLQKCQITGIDSSAAMLEISRNRFPEHNWLEADMRQLDLKQSFNGIIAWGSFFHLTHNDQRAMFHIFKQHAKPVRH